MPPAGATIQEVAKAAGVSKTTVSHVLSGNRPVSAATRRRVEKVMAELDFQPNFFAQALTSKRSNSIALIVQDITNPYYPALARGLQLSVARRGQAVMLFDAGGGEQFADTFVNEAIQRRVDGVVIAASGMASGLARLQKAGIPVVAVGSGLSGLSVDWVSADDERIAGDAVRHLHASGRSRLATIAGPRGAAPGDSRLSGFLDAAASLGIEVLPQHVAVADFTRDGGYEAMERLMGTDSSPDAVFCANDLMAIGAMEAANAAGLDIPSAIAIVGVDDIDAASLVRPALTTVHIPVEEIGQAAGDLLLHRIDEGGGASYRQVLVNHELVVRASA
ncbi:MAG: LacI family transcriptional regulator [Naasia sp.]|nr:LacI family transcriptional regulator [Naasia sp.]